MIVHRSNRTEALVEALAELVAVPPADPFVPEVIVVQGRGMARWLGLELAGRLGVWANPAFPFPRAFIDQVSTAVLGEPPAAAAVFTPEGLAWAIAAELPRHLSAPRFAPVQRFLLDDQHGSRLLPLARRVADLFDQYAVFRPELVLNWESGGGEPDDWQPTLWRALVARLGALHPAARARDLLATLRAGGTPAAPLPHRASIFGLATLPPIYVDLLAALDGLVELHLFALTPSRDYWGDLPSARERRRALSTAAGADQQLYLDAPPLLASLGRVGRDFQQVFESRVAYQDDPVDRYREPGQGSLLATLQSDLLDLRLRGGSGAAPIVLAADDTSVAIHACHGPMREVEVLHDRLTALFAADPTLRPHDVIVMTPSIDTYAPLLEAVFTSPDRPRIPFTIADRRARATRDVVDAFLRALDLLAGRLPASAVLDLLALEAVHQRFAIPAEALDTIRGWTDAAAVRWGADAAHRAAEGLPACGENTWRFGLDRLLLGSTLPSAGDPLWGGTLPCGDLEGSEAELLGQFAAFVETLMRFRRLVSAAHTPAEWRDVLGELLAAVARQKPAYADQHAAILAVLALVAERAELGGFSARIGLSAIRRLLDDELAVEPAPLGFLTGAVTLCELVPMRTVPFRVVALVGLSDGVFPRLSRPLAFDHMARAPRAGDRTPRDDDRYLFLEALLAARERLLITYVGHSITTNSELPPSVVVSELLDAIDLTARPTAAAGGPAARARSAIVHHHPLQPFSPSAFRGAGPLASYARSQYQGARALCAPRRAPPPFVAAPLPVEPLTTLTLEALIEFFRNPSRWFLRERLQLYLPREEEAPDDREPIELSYLQVWDIGRQGLARLLAGGTPETVFPVLRASGILPHGTPGRTAVDEQLGVAAAISAAARQHGIGALDEPCEVSLAIADVTLDGLLRGRAAGGLVHAQFSRVGRARELEIWIRHLVLNATLDPQATSVLVGRAEKGKETATVYFRPVADARRHLATLVALFEHGQSRPLPFFPSTSRAYVAGLHKRKPTFEGARADARKAFEGSDSMPGDGEDANVVLLYPEMPAVLGDEATPDPEAELFAVARAVFDPLFQHRVDE
ncbi:MAG TPA: exodeoxyribonuclease V subunit gamma [Candidatus Dormibacteraeota bacterium]|nr:exodeoxyribonuclease V subunit gamma [Candidatus Dormibacteraeota bacterium]